MKRNIITIIATVATLTSCNGFLTEEPILSQSDKLTLSTIEGLELATAGVYSPLASTSWYGAEFVILNEMKTSNGKKYIGTRYDSGRLNDFYNINFSESNTSGLWEIAYYTISAANNVIDNLSDKGSEQERNNLKAECLFLRALAHFDLVRTYAQPYSYSTDASHDGVPVVLHTETGKPSRSSVAAVYERIIEDLLEAESLMDPLYCRNGADPKAYADINAIRALLSRAYLYSENWEKSAEYAQKVIDSKKFALWSKDELRDAACYRMDVPAGGEVIFEVYGSKNNSYDGSHEGISGMTGPDGYGDAGCSADLMNLYESSDVRSTLFRSKDGVSWTAKYAGKGQGKPDVNNVIVLRLSEMYLNIAEAVAHGAAGYDGQGALETLALSRGASAQACTADGVFSERCKELAWEGHLWFDLARTGRDMTREDYVGSEKGRTVAAGDFRWAMPIPLREYGVNPNLSHNPGYAK